jgi:hypothetical protein
VQSGDPLSKRQQGQKSSAKPPLCAIEELIRPYDGSFACGRISLSCLEKCMVRWLNSLAITILFSVLGTHVQAQSAAPVRDDTQVWNDVQITVPLNQQFDFLMTGTLRIGRHVHRPVDERLGFGFSYKAGKYLTLAPSYTYLRTQPTRGKNQSEDRLSFAATISAPAGKFTLTDRNLFEHRYRHQQGISTRYRNRFQVQHPFKLGDMPLNWFIADEVFYDWSFNDWVRNRFTIGVSRKFNKHFTADLYYLRQNDGHSSPGDIHVLGTTFRFRR